MGPGSGETRATAKQCHPTNEKEKSEASEAKESSAPQKQFITLSVERLQSWRLNRHFTEAGANKANERKEESANDGGRERSEKLPEDNDDGSRGGKKGGKKSLLSLLSIRYSIIFCAPPFRSSDENTKSRTKNRRGSISSFLLAELKSHANLIRCCQFSRFALVHELARAAAEGEKIGGNSCIPFRLAAEAAIEPVVGKNDCTLYYYLHDDSSGGAST